MVTYAQLQTESWWNREVITPELDWLGDELCRRTGRPRAAAGSKGDNRHLNGSHRSQEWIKKSRWCTSRTYTVQSGLTAEQARHIAGFDFVPGEWGSSTNRKRMAQQTGRLIAAMKAGKLDGVLAVYGTTDGRTVTGWDNVRNRTVSSDSSHLDHWHLTIDRRRLRDRNLMERVVATVLALEDQPEKQEDDVDAEDIKQALGEVLGIAPDAKGNYLVKNHVSGGMVPPRTALEMIYKRSNQIADAVGDDETQMRAIVREELATLGPQILAVVDQRLGQLDLAEVTHEQLVASVKEGVREVLGSLDES